MTEFQSSNFPTIDEIMQLVRSIVNDTFTGVGGQQGRIIPNDAAVVIPFLNSALRKVTRKLRNEGATFPIIDGIILSAVPPVVAPNPGVFVNITFNGTNNGTTTVATPRLPGDCYQIYNVQQRVTGSNLPFVPMVQSPGGLVSAYQNQWMGCWEFRKFSLWLNGSTQTQDLMIRYLQLQPPIDTPAADFGTTPIYLPDGQDALANYIAAMYGNRLGSSDSQIAKCEKEGDDAVDEMANEYIRRSQSVPYRRESYQGAGSNNTDNTSLGSTGTTS